MLKTDSNSDGWPIQAFDSLREALIRNRSQVYQDSQDTFYNFGCPGVEVSKGTADKYWEQGMQGSLKAHHDCIKAFSESEFTDDLKKINVPTLVMHSEDDRGVPYIFTGARSVKIIKGAQLKVYKGLSRAMAKPTRNFITAALWAFFKS